MRTYKLDDSLVVWRAHLGDTRDRVLWDSVLVGRNDRGGGMVQAEFRWCRVDRTSADGLGRLKCSGEEKRRGGREERREKAEDEGNLNLLGLGSPRKLPLSCGFPQGNEADIIIFEVHPERNTSGQHVAS